MVASGKIYPEQAGLWGMAYYQSLHPEQIQTIVLSSGDLDKAMAIFQASYPIIGENYNAWYDYKTIDGKYWGYEFGTNSAVPTAVSGILVGVSRVDSSSNRIILVADKDQQTGIWRLNPRVLINSEANFTIPKGTDCQGWKLEVPSWHFTLEDEVPWGEGTISNSPLEANIGRNVRVEGYTLPYLEWINTNGNIDAGWIACGVPYPNVYLVNGCWPVSEWLPPYPDLPWSATTQK